MLENKYAQKDTKKILLLFTPWPGAHSNEKLTVHPTLQQPGWDAPYPKGKNPEVYNQSPPYNGYRIKRDSL